MPSAGALSLLSEPIRKAVRERGFEVLSGPQERAIPYILSGENVLLVAPTGTGKTEAAILPILDEIVREGLRGEGPVLLYITPLRALNRDLLERLDWWCKRFDLRLAVRHGDTPTPERARQSMAPPDILITTPETLQILLVGRRLRFQLKRVKWIVVDEVHELASDKRGAQLSIAVERLREGLAQEPQLIGLSATVGSPQRVASFLVGDGRNCRVVEAFELKRFEFHVSFPVAGTQDEELATRVLYTYPDVAARLRLIRALLDSHGSALIFTNTRSEAEALGSRFRIWDISYPVAVHHSSLSKNTRLAAELGLKEARLKGVVCTSSLEMGIDVGAVELTIQYGSPRQATRLVQRAGRSGHRLGATSKAVVVSLDPEDALESAVISRRSWRGLLEPTPVLDAPYEALAHQVAGLLIERPRWHVEDLHDIVKKAYPYRNLQPSELYSILRYMSERRPRLASFDAKAGWVSRPIEIRHLYRYYFDNLSMIPDQRQYLVVELDGGPVGALDEGFVVEHGMLGAKFVEAGSIWRVMAIEEAEVKVLPDEDPLGAIPTWVGDEIPVPFEVAQEVGEVRGAVEDSLMRGQSFEKLVDDLAQRYPVDKEAISEVTKILGQHVANGFPIATHTKLVVEGGGGQIIVQSCCGSLVNNTLAHVIAFLASKALGAPVAVQSDPYRFALSSEGLRPRLVSDIVETLPSTDLTSAAREAFEKSGAFRRRFIQVAQKFGVLSRERRLDPSSLELLAEALKGTPVYEETIKTVLQLDADLQNTALLIRGIGEGRVYVETLPEGSPLTPLAHAGLEKLVKRVEVVRGERLRALLVKATRARLLSEGRVYACVNCWSFVEAMRTVDLMAKAWCVNCSSKRLGICSEPLEYVEAMARRIRLGVSLTTKQERLKKRLQVTATVLAKHGLPAAMALSAKGLRLMAVEEILAEHPVADDKFVELVMKAERNVLRRILSHPRA